MWCHLCTQDYPNFEDFRTHIMQVHRNASELCKDSSESEESDNDNDEILEVDEEKAALNVSEKYPVSDHNITTDHTSEDNMATLNTSPRKYHDSDHIPASENKLELSMTTTNNLLGERHDDDVEDKSSTINTLKKNKQHYNKENKSDINENVSKKSPKKPTLSSILKKQVRKKKRKVVFGKKVIPKRRVPAVSFQRGISEHSDGNEMDHIKSSFNGDNVNSQSVVPVNNSVNSQSVIPINNSVNSQSVIPINNSVNSQSVVHINNSVNSHSVVPVNNYVNSQPVSNNNPVILINPYAGQGVNNNYVIGSQAVQPPVYVVNTTATNSSAPKTKKGFDFHSKNILNWLTKHKELCKNIQYPLPSSLFIQVQAVHTGIFDHYFTDSISEEATAVLKVYEELDCMIHKHINSINNALSVL